MITKIIKNGKSIILKTKIRYYIIIKLSLKIFLKIIDNTRFSKFVYTK